VLIILEGPDGGGKSTLARELAAELKAEIWHRGPPTSHPLDEYETPLFPYRPREDVDIVCDRWHVGEWVYPQVLGRKSQADDATWRHIELFLAARGALIIYIMPELDVLRQRIRQDGDWLIKESQLEEIYELYEMQTYRTDMRVNVVRHVDPAHVIAAAKGLENQAASIRHSGSYVGPPDPKMLYVGERRSFEYPYPPAFGPYPATCGHWMLSHMPMMPNTGLANAYEEDLRGLWKSLDEPRVVALGRLADNELMAAKIPHGTVPHPQYCRRFIHHEGDWYRDLIYRAATEQEDLLKCRP